MYDTRLTKEGLAVRGRLVWRRLEARGPPEHGTRR